MNLAELRAAILQYAEDDFPPAMLDTFIRQAEERIYHMVQLPALRRNDVGNLTAGNPYLAMPPGWLAVHSMYLTDPNGAAKFLRDKDVNFIRESYPSPNEFDEPRFYAVFDDDTLLVAPTPALDYAVQMHYFKRPESIVDAGTSWLGDNFESVLMYGALVMADVYMKGEQDMEKKYGQQFKEGVLLLKQYAEGKIRQDNYRTVQTRVPVG